MPHEFDESDYRLALLVAGDFRKNKLLRKLPREDIAQILAMQLAAKCSEYTPEKGDWESFARLVLKRRGLDLLREQETVNAAGWREQVTGRLDAVVGEDEGGDPLTVADIIPDGRPAMADEVAYGLDRREALLAPLTEEQREIAGHLEAGTMTQAEMAAEKGIPFSTFQSRFTYPIRVALRKAVG